jgi:hypothetical protein
MRALSLLAATLLLSALPASAQFIELERPHYDLVSVATHVLFPTATPASANEGTCLVLNTSGAPVRAWLDAYVLYSDGHVERLSRLGDPGVLEPDGGFELSVFFVIPPDVPLGTAKFVCEIRAMSLLSRREQERDFSASGFEIVSP